MLCWKHCKAIDFKLDRKSMLLLVILNYHIRSCKLQEKNHLHLHDYILQCSDLIGIKPVEFINFSLNFCYFKKCKKNSRQKIWKIIGTIVHHC